MLPPLHATPSFTPKAPSTTCPSSKRCRHRRVTATTARIAFPASLAPGLMSEAAEPAVSLVCPPDRPVFVGTNVGRPLEMPKFLRKTGDMNYSTSDVAPQVQIQLRASSSQGARFCSHALNSLGPLTQACARSARIDASRPPPVRTLLMMGLVFDLRGSGQCWLINAAAIRGAAGWL